MKLMEKVNTFYKVHAKQFTNPDYEEIVFALGSGAIKKLTHMEIEKTESQITMGELSSCLAKTRWCPL